MREIIDINNWNRKLAYNTFLIMTIHILELLLH